MAQVAFHMWEPHRRNLLAEHQFYLEQAQHRLLSQFNNMEQEADAAADDFLTKIGENFDPDSDDPDGFYEAANDAGINFYLMLSEMRNATRLSVVAGLFHQWDKRLREWMVREIRSWYTGDAVIAEIWKQDFQNLLSLFSRFGWEAVSLNAFRSLDAMRLVVNVYKHGDGKSFDDLRKKYPAYLRSEERHVSEPGIPLEFLDHNALTVSDDHIREFADAICEFVGSIPEYIFLPEKEVELPGWFEKAIRKDNAQSNDSA